MRNLILIVTLLSVSTACGAELGPTLVPAAQTAEAVVDCIHACADAPNLVDALRSKLECTPRVLAAAAAWCSSGVLESPTFCSAIGEAT